MIGVGVDFGTSNSSVAVFDGSAVRILPLDSYAPNPRVMRSLLYITRAADMLAGERALTLYAQQNTGREVKLERRYVGEVTMTFAEVGAVTKDAYALVDVNEPGRLFQSLKRFLPMTSYRGTNVFGREYSLEELVAMLARTILQRTASQVGGRLDRVVVGRPVRFSEDGQHDRAARRRLEEAWRLAGLRRVRFLEEPVAAAHHYAAQARLPQGATVLVFDFGGGTLDVTVCRAGSGSVQIVATAGVPIGGDLLDRRIMERHVADRLGRGARYLADGLPVPSHIFARLANWQTIIELNRPRLLDLIRTARRSSDRPAELAALETLVTRNYGLELFRAIEGAKIRLSDADAATVSLARQDIVVRQHLSRREFEATIAAQVGAARKTVLAAVAQAGMEPEGIDYAVTTGGSALIPAFRRMLAQTLPRATLTATDSFTSVAAGLALVAGRR